MTQDLKTPTRRGLLGSATAGAAALAVPAALAGSAHAQGKPLTLLNVSYDPTRELYKDINAAYAVLLKELRMIALLRQVAHTGSSESAKWADMRIHRVSSELMVGLGYSSKLNAEWEFLSMLRDEGRRAAQAFLTDHHEDLGRRSSLDLDELLEGV